MKEEKKKKKDVALEKSKHSRVTSERRKRTEGMKCGEMRRHWKTG